MSSVIFRHLRRAMLLSLVIAPGAAAQTEAQSGVSYRIRVSSEIVGLPDFGGPPPGGMFFQGRVTAVGDRARVDIQAMEPATPALTPGDYIIRGDSATMMIVHPARSAYTDYTGGALAALSGRGGRRGLNPMQITPDVARNLNVSDYDVVLETLGRDTVEGLAARRYRVSVKFTVDMAGSRQMLQAENDIWTADLPYNLLNPLAPGGGTSIGMVTIPADMRQLPEGFRGFAMKVDSALKQMQGTIVKTVSTMNVDGLMGGPGGGSPLAGMNIRFVQTTAFSGITAGPVDRTQLDVPAGFTRLTPGGP